MNTTDYINQLNKLELPEFTIYHPYLRTARAINIRMSDRIDLDSMGAYTPEEFASIFIDRVVYDCNRRVDAVQEVYDDPFLATGIENILLLPKQDVVDPYVTAELNESIGMVELNVCIRINILPTTEEHKQQVRDQLQAKQMLQGEFSLLNFRQHILGAVKRGEHPNCVAAVEHYTQMMKQTNN